MKRHNLAFIDLETTGLDPKKHEIIELGCLIVKQIPNPNGRGPNLEVIEELELKIKPKHLETAEPEALKINGYNEMEWLFAVELEQAMKVLAEKTKDCIMVGQNVFFDWSFLKEAFEQTGIENKMHFHRIDLISMAFAKLYHDQSLERYNLRALAEFFGVENSRAHTALADIKATFEIYKKLLDH